MKFLGCPLKHDGKLDSYQGSTIKKKLFKEDIGEK